MAINKLATWTIILTTMMMTVTRSVAMSQKCPNMNCDLVNCAATDPTNCTGIYYYPEENCDCCGSCEERKNVEPVCDLDCSSVTCDESVTKEFCDSHRGFFVEALAGGNCCNKCEPRRTGPKVLCKMSPSACDVVRCDNSATRATCQGRFSERFEDCSCCTKCVTVPKMEITTQHVVYNCLVGCNFLPCSPTKTKDNCKGQFIPADPDKCICCPRCVSEE